MQTKVGGDEKGKGKGKVYKPRNASCCWRSIDLAGDYNPFHVTMMLVTMANGKLIGTIIEFHLPAYTFVLTI